MKISVKIVENVYEAIEHINQYGTNHSEAIVTEDQLVADSLNNVNVSGGL
ncbi:Gamma-glutamyl phosphate reductase OS=Lysinibacillus sphaericus OX=1421 GN=proA PE=3 SV=1 [Lysinibacillus sphaericus]